jgi:hypothetical protein
LDLASRAWSYGNSSMNVKSLEKCRSVGRSWLQCSISAKTSINRQNVSLACLLARTLNLYTAQRGVAAHTPSRLAGDSLGRAHYRWGPTEKRKKKRWIDGARVSGAVVLPATEIRGCEGVDGDQT